MMEKGRILATGILRKCRHGRNSFDIEWLTTTTIKMSITYMEVVAAAKSAILTECDE